MTWDGAWEAAHKATWAKDEKKWKIFLDSLKEKIQVKIAAGMDIPQEMLDELGLDIPPDDPDGKKPTNESTLVKEGGHRISNATRMNQANAKAKETMAKAKDMVMRFFGLGEDDIAFLGSTGKKLNGGTSGDIDLAMPQDKVMEGTGCETPEEFIDYCQDVFEELDVYDASANGYGWKSVACFWPIANMDGKQEGKYVQLDFVVTTNMKFVTWGMHSDQEVEVPEGENPDDVNPKSGIRNAIFEAIARGGHVKILKRADIPGEGEDQPVEMERYDYKFNAGLSKVTRARQPKKKGIGYTDWKVVNREFVTDDPEEIVHILYGGEANAYDIMTPRDAWDALVDS